MCANLMSQTCTKLSPHKPVYINHIRVLFLSLSLINKNISPKTSSNKTAHAENVIAEKTKTDICTSGNRISVNGKRFRIEHTLGHVPFCCWLVLQGVRGKFEKMIRHEVCNHLKISGFSRIDHSGCNVSSAYQLRPPRENWVGACLLIATNWSVSKKWQHTTLQETETVQNKIERFQREEHGLNQPFSSPIKRF